MFVFGLNILDISSAKHQNIRHLLHAKLALIQKLENKFASFKHCLPLGGVYITTKQFCDS